jgi:predicted DNA-binding transcriptional regulator YafY
MAADLFYRQLLMLQRIPRFPKKTSARDLGDFLKEKGFDVSIRTIQRDLKEMAETFPDLRGDGKKDMQGWSWLRETTVHDIPNINEPMAFTFHLAETFLANLIPPSALQLLQPYFAHSKDILRHSRGYAQWGRHVRILSRTQPLIPAGIPREVIEVVYESLFRQKQFRGRYRKRGGDEAEYVFHPLGIIFRESVIYLVATVWEYQDPLHFALHRFKHCEPLPGDAVPPTDFNLDAYLASGTFQYPEVEGGKIKLVAFFSSGAADHLAETPLSDDQELNPKKDGRVEVSATVTDSSQLRWWLLGFGDYVEVVRPKKLRVEFESIAEHLATMYRKRTAGGDG